MSASRAIRTEGTGRARGQALVEFSLGIMVFLTMVVGLVDVGRGIYVYNSLAEAAREIARRTIVHPGTVELGTSPESVAMVAQQQGLIPGFGTPVFRCNDYDGHANDHVPCVSGDFARVIVTAQYAPAAFLGMLPSITMQSAASMEIP